MRVRVAAHAAGGFDFPDEAGDVVFGAGPVGGRAAQRGDGGERCAAVGDFAEVEPGVARADFA